jgi:predicted HicB family RNase H-like nuclease
MSRKKPRHKFLARFPRTLFHDLKKKAKTNGNSVNTEVVDAAEQHVSKTKPNP